MSDPDPDPVAAAEAELEDLLADLTPDKARELLELALTELVMGEDPEAHE